jgi:hypothetical protein
MLAQQPKNQTKSGTVRRAARPSPLVGRTFLKH